MSVEDYQLIVLSDHGLTEWGEENRRLVDRQLDEILGYTYVHTGSNPPLLLYEHYGSNNPSDSDLAAVADECDYLVSAEQLKRQADGRNEWVQRLATNLKSGDYGVSPIVDRQT